MDLTSKYILAIVGIVAIVGLVYWLEGPTVNSNAQAGIGDSLTGNVVADSSNTVSPVDIGILGRVLFGVMLIGASGYLYFKSE